MRFPTTARSTSSITLPAGSETLRMLATRFLRIRLKELDDLAGIDVQSRRFGTSSKPPLLRGEIHEGSLDSGSEIVGDVRGEQWRFQAGAGKLLQVTEHASQPIRNLPLEVITALGTVKPDRQCLDLAFGPGKRDGPAHG